MSINLPNGLLTLLGISPSTVEISLGNGSDSFNGTDANEHIQGNGGGDSINAGGGSDTVEGGAGGDSMNGGTGSDYLEGGAGGDSINGGGTGNANDTDRDTLGYSLSAKAVTITLNNNGSGTASGSGSDAQGDSFTGIENVVGSNFADTLTGNNLRNVLAGLGGNDHLKGMGGDDILVGGAGADKLDGGTGFDTADYSTSASPVNLVLGGVSTGGDAAGDTFISIENFVGTAGADVFNGSASTTGLSVDGGGGGDTMIGGQGNDQLSLGGGAALALAGFQTLAGEEGGVLDGGGGDDGLTGSHENDTMHGGGGHDTMHGGGGHDTMHGGDGHGGAGNFSLAAEATDDDDEMYGGDGDDIMDGQGGNDTLNGNAGDDFLIGGAGGDTLNGGDGIDTVSYQGSPEGVNLGAFGGGGDATGDIINDNDIENFVGSDHEDVLPGNDLDNVLTGGAGADQLGQIGGGADIVDYSNSPAGVFVSLQANVPGQGGDAEGDTYSGIRGVNGSSFDDQITAYASELIYGAGGNDFMESVQGTNTFIYKAFSDVPVGAHEQIRVTTQLGAGVVINLSAIDPDGDPDNGNGTFELGGNVNTVSEGRSVLVTVDGPDGQQMLIDIIPNGNGEVTIPNFIL